MEYRVPEKFTEIMKLQEIVDKSSENINLKDIIYLKVKLIENIINFYNTKDKTKEKKVQKMTEIVISLAQFLNFLYKNNSESFIVPQNKMLAFFNEYQYKIKYDEIDYILYDFSYNYYNVPFSNEELILGLIEAITDFKLKLRSILEILCNFGGLYEINIKDIYKEYFKFWKNEMEM